MDKTIELAAEFDQFCYSRHKIGAELYGNFKFLSNDNLIGDMLEELADLSNYARYMYIRVRLMGEALASRTDSTPFVSNAEHSDGLDFGPSAFIPTDKVQRRDQE